VWLVPQYRVAEMFTTILTITSIWIVGAIVLAVEIVNAPTIHNAGETIEENPHSENTMRKAA
jgi:hypothetical protein